MIKAVIFDVDGVLLDSFAANTKFFQDLLVDSGYKKPTKKEVMRIFHTNMLNTIRILTKETSEDKINKIWRKGHTFPYPNELLKMPSRSKETIIKISGKYKLGIVTSRIKRGIKTFFDLSHTKNYFDVVVTYEDTTKHKPEPEPLLLAAKRLKVKPSEAVYIGDGMSDMIAARAAKMKYIHYSKTKVKGPDLQVKSFREILSTIQQLM